MAAGRARLNAEKGYDAVLSNVDLSGHIVRHLSSGYYLVPPENTSKYPKGRALRQKQARNHMRCLSRLSLTNRTFRTLCNEAFDAILSAYSHSRERFVNKVDAIHRPTLQSVDFDQSVFHEPFASLHIPIGVCLHRIRLVTLKDLALSPPTTTPAMIFARLKQRCMCCVGLDQCGCEDFTNDCWEEQSWKGGSWIVHPNMGSFEDPGSDFNESCFPLPYTSKKHLADLEIVQTQGCDGTTTYTANVPGDDHSLIRIRPWLRTKLSNALMSVKAHGLLDASLRRVVDAKWKAHSRTAFIATLPLTRLKHGGIGLPDCSMAELFGVTDAEFWVHAKLGEDVTNAKHRDAILSSNDVRGTFLASCVLQIQASGKGGAIWTLDEKQRLDPVTFEAPEQLIGSLETTNSLWFNTWGPGRFLTQPITTFAAAQKAHGLVNKDDVRYDRLRAVLDSYLMLRHFERIEQIAGLVFASHRDTLKSLPITKEIIKIVKQAITAVPQKEVLPRLDWDCGAGAVTPTAGFVHGDLILRNLLNNIVREGRLCIRATHAMASNPSLLVRVRGLKMDAHREEQFARKVRFRDLCVRLCIDTGENTSGTTNKNVILFGAIRVSTFLSLTLSLPGFEPLHQYYDQQDERTLHPLSPPDRLIELGDAFRTMKKVTTTLTTFLKTRCEESLHMLRMLLCEHWTTYNYPVLRNGCRQLLHFNKSYASADVKSICEGKKLMRCICSQRCTFSGRRPNQCVFGASSVEMSQSILDCDHFSTLAAAAASQGQENTHGSEDEEESETSDDAEDEKGGEDEETNSSQEEDDI